MRNKDFDLDQEVDGLHLAVEACFHKIPQCLWLPESWIIIPPVKSATDDDKDLKFKYWVKAYVTLNFNNYWHDQEQEFLAIMRLIDYCSSAWDLKDSNLIYHKITNCVDPFLTDNYKKQQTIR